MQTKYLYPADVEADETGAFVIRIPDFQGCVTDGPSLAEALLEAADALEEAIAHQIKDGLPLPKASPAMGRPCVTPGVLIAAKAALHEAVLAAGINKSDLARRLGVAETEARRMLDPQHPTKISRIEEALAALGKRLVVEVRDAA